MEESHFCYVNGESWEFYENKKCAHVKNQVLFAQILHQYVLQLVNQIMAYNERKFVQFVVIQYLLAHGTPMTNFENVKSFLKLLKVKHYPKKHQCDNVGWGMFETFNSIIIQAMKLVLDKTNVFVLFCNEIILIDNQS